MRTSVRKPITDAVSSIRRLWKRGPRFSAKWLLAHDPPVVFEEAAARFVLQVFERTGGEVEILPMTTSAYFAGHGGEFLESRETIQCLVSGEVQMAHTYLASLGAIHKRLWALEAPFLFRDHGHAMRVLDGPIGQELMRELKAVGLRGIAFAYSGGYRIIPSPARELRRLEDFKGVRVRTSGNPVTISFLETLGAVPVEGPLQEILPLLRRGEIDAAETTYVRYMAQEFHRPLPIINHTQHSLFMTILVINEEFFQSLPRKYQTLIADLARNACLEERTSSIDLEESLQVSLPETKGVKIVPLAPGERERLIDAARPVYERFDPFFGRGFLRSLREHP